MSTPMAHPKPTRIPDHPREGRRLTHTGRTLSAAQRRELERIQLLCERLGAWYYPVPVYTAEERSR